MFTSMDKAISAVIMAGLFLLNNIWGINFGFTEVQVNSFLAIILPLVVYFIPNKTTTPAKP